MRQREQVVRAMSNGDTSSRLNESELTEPRACIDSFVKEIEFKPARPNRRGSNSPVRIAAPGITGPLSKVQQRFCLPCTLVGLH